MLLTVIEFILKLHLKLSARLTARQGILSPDAFPGRGHFPLRDPAI
jgi:hypothetical protein